MMEEIAGLPAYMVYTVVIIVVLVIGLMLYLATQNKDMLEWIFSALLGVTKT